MGSVEAPALTQEEDEEVSQLQQRPLQAK